MTIQSSSETNNSPRFIPLIVQFVTPINMIVVIIAMVGVFVLANNISNNADIVEQNLLIQTTQSVAEASQSKYNQLVQQAQRVAYTQGIGSTLENPNINNLQTILEPLGITSALDSIIITDANGQEIIGLLYDTQANDFSLSQQTDLSTQSLVADILNGTETVSTGLLQTPNGTGLYVAIAIRNNEIPVGVALAGNYLSKFLETIQIDTIADVTVYNPTGKLLATTVSLSNENQPLFDISTEIIAQTLSTSNQITIADNLSLDGQDYRSAYIPLSLDEQTLGVMSIIIPDNVTFITAGGRQVAAFLMAIIAGAVTFVAVISISRFTGRLETITHTVEALSRGQDVRADIPATDEIGKLATTVNLYADNVRKREDHFRETLQRFRRERDYLLLAFEAIPEGVVVQDPEGRVLLMNDVARNLLGSQRVFRSAGIHELSELVSETLGKTIVPGLYALGNPQRIPLDEKVLLAQASAIVVSNGHRLGSVILLRDITSDVERDQAQERIMAKIIEDVGVSLQDNSRRAMQNRDEIMRRFARDIAKHASTLQSMIVEMRELTRYTPQKTPRIQRALQLETLVWAVANDWRQIALANKISINVILEKRGLFILGDEQRLRYAIGNIIDNSIKYTHENGKLSIEIRGEGDGMARLRVRDNGVGIRQEDMEHIFTRYYRGTPTTTSGNIIQVPGMGQGLADTQQIINSHGGSIRIKSKVDIGTAVYIEIPVTSSASYQLPLLDDDVMEGETMLIPEHIDTSTFWDGDEL